MHFLVEALIVGVLLMVLGFILSYIMMGKDAKDFQHWNRVLLTYFLAGAIFHILCELAGVNKKYCESKKA